MIRNPKCKKHGTLKVLNSAGKGICKQCNSEKVTKARKRLKQACVEYKGGECERCGYKKYIGALEFHHLNPNEKDFAISEKGNIKSIHSLKIELDKCIMVCSNCHKEIHGGC